MAKPVPAGRRSPPRPFRGIITLRRLTTSSARRLWPARRRVVAEVFQRQPRSDGGHGARQGPPTTNLVTHARPAVDCQSLRSSRKGRTQWRQGLRLTNPARAPPKGHSLHAHRDRDVIDGLLRGGPTRRDPSWWGFWPAVRSHDGFPGAEGPPVGPGQDPGALGSQPCDQLHQRNPGSLVCGYRPGIAVGGDASGQWFWIRRPRDTP